jgi:hypothetical protein
MLRVDVAESVAAGHDFGDVAVDAGRRLALDVRDSEGRPVREPSVIVERHASAWEVLGCNRFCVVDAAHVRTGFGVPPEAIAIRVLAPGFVAEETPREPAATPRLVELEPCAQLELDVRDERDRVLRSASLEVSAAGWPLAWSFEDLCEAHRSSGGSGVERVRDSTDARTSCTFSSYDVPFRVLALRTRIPITLVVRDSIGIEVLRETITAEPGDRRDLRRTAERSARTIRGMVMAPDGTPLADASVSFFQSRRWMKVSTQTASDGTFRLAGVRADRGTLVAAHQGYSQKSLRSHLVDETRPVEIVLEKGWSVQVELAGDRRPTIPSAIWMEAVASRPTPDGADEMPLHGAIEPVMSQESAFTFEGLSDEPMWLRATVEGFTFAIRMKNADWGSTTFNVMLRGQFETDWSVDGAASNGRVLRALSLQPEGDKFEAGATAAIDPADAARGRGLARFGKLPIVARFTDALVWAEPDGRLVVEPTDVTIEPRTTQRAPILLRR